MQEWQTLINISAAAIVGLTGWWCRAIWESVNRLQNQIHDLEVMLPNSYVRKDEFHDAVRTIFDKLDRIYDKLENKIDSKADR